MIIDKDKKCVEGLYMFYLINRCGYDNCYIKDSI